MSEKRESYHDYMGRRLREESEKARNKYIEAYTYPYDNMSLVDIINDLKKRIEVLEKLERNRNANI